LPDIASHRLRRPVPAHWSPAAAIVPRRPPYAVCRAGQRAQRPTLSGHLWGGL